MLAIRLKFVKKIFIPALLLMGYLALSAQSLNYQTPPQSLVAIVDAIPTPTVDISPDYQWLLILERPNLPSIAEVSQPELRLAGIRINPTTNGPSRSRYFSKIQLKNIFNGATANIDLPLGGQIENIRWAPDSKHIAFTLTIESEIQFWIIDVQAKNARRLSNLNANSALIAPLHWLSDSKRLVCVTVLQDRGDPPQQQTTPQGPVIQENLGKTAPARTYQDLLKNPHDESLFDYYLTSQIVLISLSGEVKHIGKPAIYSSIVPSPDAKHLLIETIHRPYSYIVPVYRFPHKIEVWNLEGELLYELADIPLAETIPIGFNAVRTGPRAAGWRSDKPATLYWVETQDDGDPNKPVDIRDIIFTLATPFSGQARQLISLSLRFNQIIWGADQLALISESWWRTRQTRTWMASPADPSQKAKLLIDRSYEDRYADPGAPVTIYNKSGARVLLTADGGHSIFLIG
ncbi:MAG: S9 family peptidase, partial [bacterium]|nr:S9 family peptidase [bacterium]